MTRYDGEIKSVPLAVFIDELRNVAEMFSPEERHKLVIKFEGDIDGVVDFTVSLPVPKPVKPSAPDARWKPAKDVARDALDLSKYDLGITNA